VQNRIKDVIAEHQKNEPDLDKRRFWSQEAVAGRVGISVFTFNRIANGKQDCGMRLRKAIARALKRPVEEVFPQVAPKRKARVG
jgi:DNA-binding XRE family transcriptional regulator